MKVYSEILDKLFDNEKECLTAEKEYAIQQKKEELAKEELIKKEKEEKVLIANEKKALAEKIEETEKELDEANNKYKLAQDKAAEILEKSNKEVAEILKVAREEVKQAERNKRDAIIAFNEKFGNYKVTYTGDKAIEEFNKAMNYVDSVMSPFADFFKFWF